MKKTLEKTHNVNRKKHTGGLVLLCLFLLVLCGSILFGLYESRQKMQKECENTLLREVQINAKEVSDSIKTKFATLETIEEMVGISEDINAGITKVLEASRKHYTMGHLGIIDTEYVCYDNEGDIIPNMRTKNIEAAMQGNYIMVRSVDEVSGDGVVFFIPCHKGDEIIGVLYSKYARMDLLEELGIEADEGLELVIDKTGKIVFMSDDPGNYLGGQSWEEFYENTDWWEKKQAFDIELKLKGSMVASATNKHGEEFYFAAAQVGQYSDFYVVRLIGADVVEKEIKDELFRNRVLMALMVVFMIGIVCFALVSYFKNRKAVYQVAYVDELTGLPSKAKHKMDAQVLLDKQEQRYAYVTFDVDNFKYINEMFDYEYGNQMLIHIGKVVTHFTKKNELCARISSDNFAMLWEDEGSKEDLTNRIRDLFNQIVDYREPEEVVTVCTMKFSCGVYRIEEIKDINAIRANANLARTECKKRALEDIVFYDDGMKNQRVEEKELEYDAKTALENNEFLVYFQPKYDVDTEKIIGAEALVRWEHPVRGILSPGSFIPVFEYNGFIVDLDLYVLDKVCELISAWLKVGITPVCISVNLSRMHLYEQDMVAKLTEVVNRYNVPPEYIEFELTESAFYEETDRLLRIMSEIKEAGFRLSMDDFGSGYSSLNLLRRLPVDVLKLDKAFFDNGEEHDEARGKRIVMHVISMAKDLEMEVVAEGVETKDQKDFLQGAKCDMIQGYYFARPMPLKEFELLYRGQNFLQRSAHESAVEKQIEEEVQKRTETQEQDKI